LPFRWNVARSASPQPESPAHRSLTKALALAALAVACGLAVSGCKRAHGPDVMATVNGKPILRSEVETYYRNNLGDSQQEPPKDQADIVRLNIVRQLIDQEILQQRAAKLNLMASDEEIEAKLNELKAPYTQEEFNQRLKAKHLTIDDLKRDIRRDLTQTKVLNKEINSKIDISDTDITSYYNAHKSDFNLIEPQYHLAQIVVTPNPAAPQEGSNLQNSKATTDADARKKIEMLHTRLETGEDFATLAMNFSEDPNTASNGGDLGFITESQLRGRPEAYGIISKLKPGQFSDVLPVADPATKKVAMYIVFRLLDKQAAGQRELNDPRVQQSIRQQLRDGRSSLLKNAYFEMLRDQAHVENYFAEDIFKSSGK
jgi:peptidyl-prolyl cis-trans isomerase SurA